MAEIELRSLGKSDLKVTPIGLGAMQFSGGRGMFRYFLSALPQATVNNVVEAALNSGINWIDTAEIYGNGASEKSVSEALRVIGKPTGDVLITTKWFPLFKTAGSIPKSASKSSRRLEPYPIDLYLVHQPYSLSSVRNQMDGMANLVDEGIVRAIGVSNFSRDKMIEAAETLESRGIPLAVNQVRWSLIDRSIEKNGVLEAAKDLGVTVIAYTPLGMGLLTGNLHRNPEVMNTMPRFRRAMLKRNLERTRSLIEAIEAIANEVNATPAQVSLSWGTNFHGPSIVAIPGASKPNQAIQNAGSMRVHLSREQMEVLNDASLGLN
ncbi:MAG: aldo/keto reductase [Candidatus Thorarchaeota archaeon]